MIQISFGRCEAETTRTKPLGRASRDTPIIYPKIGHSEEYFLPFIYHIRNSDHRMDNVSQTFFFHVK